MAQPPRTTEAIVRRYGSAIASSPTDIQRGQTVALDRYGVAIARPGYTRMVRLWRLGIYAAAIGAAVAMFSGAWLIGGVLYAGALAPIGYARYRGHATFAVVQTLALDGDLAEAQRRLDAVPQLRRRNPFMYCWLAGTLASYRGDHAAAERAFRATLPHARNVHRELIKLRIATSLLLAGRTEPARRELDAVAFPPSADDVLTGQLLARALFALCDPSSPPLSDDDLHDWARRALAYSHTGRELAAIGWAFDRRGDADMARFLADEAGGRMHNPYLATWWPALQQWLDGMARPAG